MGKKFIFFCFPQGCGGTVDLWAGNSTSLMSPGYPGPPGYQPNLYCEWIVNSPPNYRIQLKVEDMEIESHSTCQYDRLDVYDGRTKYPRHKPCGDRANGIIFMIFFFSSGNWRFKLCSQPNTLSADSKGHDSGFGWTKHKTRFYHRRKCVQAWIQFDAHGGMRRLENGWIENKHRSGTVQDFLSLSFGTLLVESVEIFHNFNLSL